MYRPLGTARLKAGDMLQLGVVECPAPDWSEHVEPFLGHKGASAREHIHRALREPMGSLKTSFYVGQRDGLVVTQVMIVHNRWVGILGHVYTHPDHRRQGAYRAVMERQMIDMRDIGMRVLTLGTGFDSPPYWIYHSFGFRSVAAGSGSMRWEAEAGLVESLYQPGDAMEVAPLEWGHWPWLNLLATLPVAEGEALPRSVAFSLVGQGSVEGPFMTWQLHQERGECQGLALVSETGVVGGYLQLTPAPAPFRENWLVDCYTHPAFESEAPRLLKRVPWPAEPAVLLRTTMSPALQQAWREAGFVQTGTMPRWLRSGDQRLDLDVWVRA